MDKWNNALCLFFNFLTLNFHIIRTSELMCDFIGCGKVFKKKAGWRKHINYFHLTEGSGGVPCDDCGIVYQNFFYLRIHKRHSELRMEP